MAVVAITNFTHENYELTYSVKFLRIIMLIFTQIFGLYGFIGGIIFTLAVVGLNKTIAGTSYVYPLMPLDFKVFLQRFYRVSLKAKNKKWNKKAKMNWFYNQKNVNEITVVAKFV